ncbi:unnamed protein product [Rotaria sordida]|uniref:Uncharacterized protein n=1 Tax=Rotaria sordida TaxID=392033 RepID=A0A818HGA8_9BILA|nr:unnamed protein product [Rotaria sordida]
MMGDLKCAGILLHAHRNKYEYPKEKLIVMVHWTFLIMNFKIVKNNEYNNIMDEIKSEKKSTDIHDLPPDLLISLETIDWVKSETNSIDIDYFRENFLIHTKQYFDNENFFIEFKTDENIQLHLQLPVNEFVNEDNGSLIDPTEFVIRIENEIYELTRRKKQMDKNKEKELEQQQKKQY